MNEAGESGEKARSNGTAFDLANVPDVVDQAAATAFFVGLSGAHAGKLFRVPLGESILGRSSRSLIAFDEKAISQHHGRLFLEAGRCVLSDSGSTNGIYVNDVRLVAPAELHAGDVIRLGRATFGFLTDASDETQHTRALARATATGGLRLGEKKTDRPAADIVPSRAVLDVAGHTPGGLDLALDRLALVRALLARYWKPLVGGLLLGAVLGAASVLVRPPVATATFQIFLKQHGVDRTQGPFATVGAEYFLFASRAFTSSDLVKETMRSFDMPTNDMDYVDVVASQLSLRSEDQNIYVGTFYDPDPSFAERFLASHLHHYLEREIGKSIRVLASEVALLRKQYEENEAQLDATEKELRDFKQAHLAGLPELAVGQLEARAELQNRAVALRANLERYSQEYDLTKKQHAQGNAIVATRVDRAEPYSAKLAQVRQSIIGLKSKGYKDESPELTELRTEEKGLLDEQARALSAAADATEVQANREQTALGDRVDRLSVDVTSTKKELDLVQGRLGEIDKIASSMPAVEAQFSSLSRTLNAEQSLHQHLHEQLKAKELKLEFERASVAGRYEVLEPPSATPPRPGRVIGLRAAGGALGGLVIALAAAGLHWLSHYAKKRGSLLPAAPSRAPAHGPNTSVGE